LQTLNQAFEKRYGRIRRSYFCRNTEAAAVLTDKWEVLITRAADMPAESSAKGIRQPGINAMLLLCELTAIELTSRLLFEAKATCSKMIFAVAASLLEMLDHESVSGAEVDASRLKPQEAALIRINRFYRETARQQVQRFYVISMFFLPTIVAYFAAAGLLFAAGEDVSTVGQTIRVFVTDLGISNAGAAALAAGGAGAMVSVLNRLTVDPIAINFRSPLPIVAIAGAARPLIGAVFAGLVYVLIKSTLVPVAVDGDKEMWFFTGLGFIAGFSERFAPDLVAGTVRKVGVAGGTVQPPAEPTMVGDPLDEAEITPTPSPGGASPSNP